MLEENVCDPESIAGIVCDPSTDFSLRRELSLYAILEGNLSFRFNPELKQGSSSGWAPELRLVRIRNYKVDGDQKIELIKDWLTWVVRDMYGEQVPEGLPFKTKTMHSLLLRWPRLAQDHLMVHNHWTSAVTLASFEDTLFRESLIPSGSEDLVPELRMILEESVSALRCSDWLLCLAHSTWYFKKGSFIHNLMEVIEN
jgi:hypothetical protein